MTTPERGFRGKGICFVAAALVTLADLWTKHAVFDAVGDTELRWLAGQWLGLRKVENTGIMWGALPQFAAVLRWVRVLAAFVVLGLLRSTPAGARPVVIALGLVLGGAIGNIYDGFSFGKVRDFILVDLDIPLFDPFPVFNIADSAICVGVVMLALGLGHRARSDRRGGGEPASDRMDASRR